jgi:hypothetical protein
MWAFDYGPAGLFVRVGGCRKVAAQPKLRCFQGRRLMGTKHSGKRDFAGNKSFLPSKPCMACGRPTTWRKKWEKNWNEVKYCSEACRKRGDAR